MERREFLRSLAACTATLSLAQIETLLAAVGFQQDGPYNGPLLTSYVNSTCGACPGGCGIRVRKVDGIPVKIDGNPIHPVSRGGLCPVGVSSLGFLVHPDRIRQPLVRTGPRGSGEFSPVSWDEAERLLAKKLTELKNAGRPEQLLFIDSRGKGVGLDLARKFTYDFGSPNFYHTLDPNLTAAASIWGGEGTKAGYDLENARHIFCFGYPVFESGRNPVYYAGLRNRLLNPPEGEKGSFVIIDPRLSASAAKAERWVPIRPGTYGLLALGILYMIIKEELYDHGTVSRHCVGFDDKIDRNGRKVEGFKSFVLKNYYPSFVSGKTGVPVDQIIWLARLFAATPGAIAITGDSAYQMIDGVYQVWAIMALNAVAGKFGAPGGVGSFASSIFKNLMTKKAKAKPVVSASGGRFPYLSGAGSIESLPERILSEEPYPVKLAIFNGINPVYSSPYSNRFRQALQNIPFSVVFASLHNETSVLADLVLPDCSFLEKHDLVIPSSDFPFTVVSLMQPVIKPLFNSRQSDEVVVSLGRKQLGGDWKKWSNYQSYLEDKSREIYEANAGTLFSDQFKVSFESLLAERGWRQQKYNDFKDFTDQFRAAGGWWNPLRLSHYEQERFPSASGKFYLDSKPLRIRLQRSGYTLEKLLNGSGLEAKQGDGFMVGAYRNFEKDEEAQFPLDLYLIELTTLRGDGGRLKAMADMVGYYQDIKWQSWVELNPETAKGLGLSDKQKVWVESVHGKQRLMLLFNPGLVPKVAAVPVGFGKQGTYTSGEVISKILSSARDVFTGMAARMETKVKIYA